MSTAFWDFSEGATTQMMMGALMAAGLDREAWSKAMSRVSFAQWRVDAGSHEEGPCPAVRARVLTDGRAVPLRCLGESLQEAQPRALSDSLLQTVALLPPDTAVNASEAVALVGVCIAAQMLTLTRQWRTPLAVNPAHVPQFAALLAGQAITIRSDRAVGVSLPGIVGAVSMAAHVAAWVPLCMRSVGVGLGEEPAEPSHATPSDRVTVTIGNESSLGTATVFEVCATVDDMDPELIPPALSSLRDAGALEAWWAPVVTRGGRPGVTIHVLCGAERLGALSDAVFRQTTTIGLRFHEVHRHTLPRAERTVHIDSGDIRIKEVTLPDGTVRWKPEFGDCARAARATGLTIDDIREAVRRSREGHSRS